MTAALARIPAWVLALGCGLIAALAHPPFGFIAGILAYGLMMRLGDGALTLRSAFWRGWLCGLGYFAIGCWWVAEAFFVDAETFAWMAPFAVCALAGGLALFWGVALTLYRLIAPTGPLRVLVFAGVFCVLEWLRGHVMTGLPWDLPGTSWGAGDFVSQAARLIGVYGLTYVTLAIAAAPTLLFDRENRRGGIVATGVAAVTLAALVGYGAWRTGEPLGDEVMTVRVIQPNVPQYARYNQALYGQIVDKYLALTAAPPKDGRPAPQIIVWPEGALPTSLDNFLAPGDGVRVAITQALKPGQILLVGGYRSDGVKTFNSLVALRRGAADLEVLGVYDKYHLVPFGEYVPAFLVPLGFKKLVPLEPFTPGPPPQPIDIGALRIQPLICYEALFPGYVWRGGKLSGRPAQVIVNVSNDAWFGKTSGPLQHLNQARYRAIEEGLPMIRATPTGISTVIDRYGRTRQAGQIKLGKSGMLDAQVRYSPRKDVAASSDVHRKVPYLRSSDAGLVVLLAISCLISVVQRSRRRKKSVTLRLRSNNCARGRCF